jgi:hypothetical protein
MRDSLFLTKRSENFKKIEHDLDCYAIEKMTKRLADKAWRDRQALPLGPELQGFADSLDDSEEDLESEKGNRNIPWCCRPGMKPGQYFCSCCSGVTLTLLLMYGQPTELLIQ